VQNNLLILDLKGNLYFLPVSVMIGNIIVQQTINNIKFIFVHNFIYNISIEKWTI